MQGSTPERRISFLPLRDDIMALAVSTDDLAATRLTKTGAPVNTPLPQRPCGCLCRARRCGSRAFCRLACG